MANFTIDPYDLGLWPTMQIPGSFTFATLPAIANLPVGVHCYTSDAGMCAWNGTAWGGITAPAAGVSILNYGAISGSDCSAAVTRAAAANALVIFPSGVWPMATTPTVPLGVVLQAMPGSSFSGAGSTALGLNDTDFMQINVVEGSTPTGPFVDVLRINHSYGGTGMLGGRNSLEVQSGIVAPTSPSNTNRNYVAGAFQCQAVTNDNGTNPGAAGTSAGAVFGVNAVAILGGTATSYLNLSGMEVNIAARTATSVYYRSGIQICELPFSAVKGTVFDAALSLSSQAGAVGWNNGILFNLGNGQHPVVAAGNLIATQGAYTCANGINLTSYTFTGQSFSSTGFAVQGGGTQIDMGIASSFHQTLHHTSAAAYDTRIVSQSGTGVTGAGDLLLNSGKLGFFAAASGGAKAVGYGTPTGNAYQASFSAAAITLPNLAAAVAQIILDLKSYTLIGA